MVGVVGAGTVALVFLTRPAPAPQGRIVVADQPTLVRLSGQLRLWRDGASQSMQVTDSAVVAPRDRVETDDRGRATITWPGGGSASLDPQSLVELVNGTDGPVVVRLANGAVWIQAGEAAAEQPAAVLANDTLRVTGARFLAQRPADGRLVVRTTDAPAELTAGGTRRSIPRGSTSQAFPDGGPSLPRPLVAPRAFVAAVEGAAAWLLVDPLGRVLGQPPEGGGWVGQIANASGPYPLPSGAAAIVPAEPGQWRLLLWGGAQPRARVALGLVEGDALFDDRLPATPPDALSMGHALRPGVVRTLEFRIADQRLQLVGSAEVEGKLPADLRLAVPPARAPTAVPTLSLAPAPVAPPSAPATAQEPHADLGPDPEPPGVAATTAAPEPTAPVASAAPEPTVLASLPPRVAAPEESSTAVESPVAPAEPAPLGTADDSAEPAPPSPTPQGATFGRNLLGFAPPPPTNTPVPTPTPSPAEATPLPSPTALPTATPPAPATATRVPTRPPATPPLLPTIVLPPTPLVVATQPPAAPSGPTRVVAPRGGTGASGGAPPSGAPPGGLGANAWGLPAAGAAPGGGASSGGAASGTSSGAASGTSGGAAGTSGGATGGARGASAPARPRFLATDRLAAAIDRLAAVRGDLP